MASPDLDDIDRMHDERPAEAAAALRRLAAQGVVADDLPRFAWLLNHVIGEAENDWASVLALHLGCAVQGLPPGALRHRAAAALLAGNVPQLERDQSVLARLGGSAPAAACLVQLSALQHQARRHQPTELVRQLEAALERLADAGPTLGLTTMLAATLNNVVSVVLERVEPPVSDARVRRVIVSGALACRRLWLKAGTWVNHERADYLVALCCNHVQDWEGARVSAQRGLDTIAANGSEDVDRAFLLLELGRAWRGLGDPVRSAEARAQALGLADGFDEPGLRDWFDARAAA